MQLVSTHSLVMQNAKNRKLELHLMTQFVPGHHFYICFPHSIFCVMSSSDLVHFSNMLIVITAVHGKDE